MPQEKQEGELHYGAAYRTVTADCITDLERQLAEADANHEAVIEEWKAAMHEIERLQAEIEAMRPVLSSIQAQFKHHNTITTCVCDDCQWYRDYESRKQP